MKTIVLCLSLWVPFHPVLANERLPGDVRNFIDQREGCDHMRGELPDPVDKHRARRLQRETQTLCNGTDQKLAQLKKKYAKNSSVMQRLDAFEPAIKEVRKPALSNRGGRHPR
ncbi:hypothetical protein HAV22_09525 [Massilia sp. TW-1]|uniref:Uncharacterized protein n=1 Tax=Telluria antibiotica TaxID=2717319 RepID=A0ABX0P9B3_9BURK|nr:hypothetical protein [Telluria antibiotica]NIA53885.1 hypothetical protein [Telluria antibiotica]